MKAFSTLSTARSIWGSPTRLLSLLCQSHRLLWTISVSCCLAVAGAKAQAPDRTLLPPDGDKFFGFSVAISESLIVVGTPLDDTTGTGSAYVYDLSGATPAVPVVILNNPAPAFEDAFGISVAISGRLVVIGAPYDDAGAIDAGSVYVYDLNSGTPTVPFATLNNPGPNEGDLFGQSVAIDGTRVVVGTPNNRSNSGAEAGSAYVYDLSSGTPAVPVAILNNPAPAAGDQFGNSVAISGTRVVVGTPFDRSGADGAGSAYVYDLSSGTPTAPMATLNNPSPAADDLFGYSVGISGIRVVVGAPFDATGASFSGSAYVYDLNGGTPTVPAATLNNPSPAVNDGFGIAVAISGTRIVVGARGDNTGASDAGSAYVYDLSNGIPIVLVGTLNNPIPAADDQFGYSVAIDGTRAVIGAPFDDSPEAEGAAHVYTLTAINQRPTIILTTTPNDGSTLSPGEKFTLSASATDDSAVESVAFVINGSVVHRTNLAPYQFETSLSVPGDYTLTARAYDNQGASTDSGEVKIHILSPGSAIYDFVGFNGNSWNDGSNWLHREGGGLRPGVPGPSDLARLFHNDVSIGSKNITVGSLTMLNGSNVGGNGTLTVNNTLTFDSGTLTDLHVIIPRGGQFVISGFDEKMFTHVNITNFGVTSCSGPGAINGDAGTVFDNKLFIDSTGLGGVEKALFRIDSPGNGPVTTATFGQFTNAGNVQIRGKLAAGSYTQNAGGNLNLNAYFDDGKPGPLGLAVLEANPVQFNGGSVIGNGVIKGTVINKGGLVLPGHSAGSINVLGDYIQEANGVLALEIGGTQAGEFDQFTVSGKATLDGTLSIRTIDNFTPDPATSFLPLLFSEVSGNFAKISSNANAVITPNAVEVKVTGPNPTPQTQNISTRLSVQSGDNVLIGGFIITGPSGTTKKVALRAIGPSLANFGITNPLPDPLIELHQSDGTTLTNNDWKEAANANEVPAVLQPGDDRESILLVSLPPGAHTAIVKGANGETGVGLAEVYDLDPPSATYLANISTRGLVQTDDNVLIGGFIIGGIDPAKVLVRAIGPSLAQFGVNAPLLDPLLEIHDANGAALGNDDWRSTQEAEIEATTIPPSNDHESAVLATLTPGQYTAIVRGKNEATGVALVEVYNLQ